ncbi:MAG: chorismate-binding protein [Acidimicrobiales bacterium]
MATPHSPASPVPPSSELILRRAIAPVPDADGGRRWLSFTDPETTLVARTLDEVRPVLAAAERAANEGRWAVGYVAYDAGPAFDPAIAVRPPLAGQAPLAVFGVFAEAVDDPGDDSGDFASLGWEPTVPRADYEAAVLAIKEHIARGETYQVNLTQRLHGRVEGDPLALFRSLTRSQQGDHTVFLDLGDHAICSASPELFFRSAPSSDGGRRLLSKPMKGTAARSGSPRLDAERRAGLAASTKDRAENTMITDMMRNDFGRVARVGTVEVPDLHVIESFPTVHQMISTVTAETDATLVEVFDACFPAASITGAPKVSTSRIITGLETDARGVYCGAIGVIAPEGMAEFNVAIRTVTVDCRSGDASYGVGGGIVWDSEPALEWFETRTKTAVLESAPGPFSLFETMRFDPGLGIALLRRHLERLEASARRFGFVYDAAAIAVVLAPYLAPVELGGVAEATRLRLQLAPDGDLRLDVRPLTRPWVSLDDGQTVPETVALAPAPVRSDDLFLRHKTTRRDVYAAALADAPLGTADVVLWNERGELTETTIGNLVVEVGDELVTPPVRCGLLPGTMRADLIAHDKLVERVVTLDDLERAIGVFRINSVRGWTPLDVVTDS